MRTLSLLAGLILATPVFAQEQGSTSIEQRWFADFDKAVAVAKEEGKDLLVDFTGSDWCGWCIKLHEEVFQFDSFYKPVSEKFVLVALDFPNSEEVKAKVPNPARNEELMHKYQVTGFPTILLMNPEGEVFAQTGYQEGGPDKYIQHVNLISTNGKETIAKAKVLVAEYETAKDKVIVVRKAMQALATADAGSPAAPVLASLVRKGFELDPKNESGLKIEALKALFAADQAADQEREMALAMDPKNEDGLYEQAIVAQMMGVRDEATATAAVDALLKMRKIGKVHQPKQFQGMVIQAAKWCEMENLLNRMDDAKTLAAWAKEIAELDAQAQALLKEIL